MRLKNRKSNFSYIDIEDSILFLIHCFKVFDLECLVVPRFERSDYYAVLWLALFSYKMRIQIILQ